MGQELFFLFGEKLFLFIDGGIDGIALIEKDQNFGYVGRIFTGWGDDVESNFAKQQEGQLKETIKNLLKKRVTKIYFHYF